MGAWLDQFLQWFSGIAGVGTVSWLQVFAWIAALMGAGIAAVSLRRNSLQSRATLLLNLYKLWEDLAPQRQEVDRVCHATRARVLKEHGLLQREEQIEHVRKAFTIKLATLRDNRRPQFRKFIAYVGFFEVVGMYVKNGYVPLRDVIQVYKGPVLDLDIVWRDFIKEWQQHVAPGLLEHALFLMDMVQVRAKRPIYYWTIYRFKRLL